MSDLIVTAEATDALGRTVTGSATAGVLDAPPCDPAGATRWLISLAGVVERHAAAFRRDLERLLEREERDERDDGFGWFSREDGGEGGRM